MAQSVVALEVPYTERLVGTNIAFSNANLPK